MTSPVQVFRPGDDRPGGTDRLPEEPATEQTDMSEQSEEAVRRQVLLPAVRHRVGLFVAGEDLLEKRGAEERKQGQVFQSVTAVRGRIDESDTVWRPHEVTRPQISMDACRRFLAFAADPGEGSGSDRIDRRGDRRPIRTREIPGNRSDQRTQALLDPIVGEVVDRLGRHLEGIVEGAEERLRSR